MKQHIQSSLLFISLGLLVAGCTSAQSAQPASTTIPSTEEVSTPALTPTASAELAAATAVSASSPVAASPVAAVATPIASAATPVAAEVIIVRLGRAASELAPGNDLVLHTITFQPGSNLLPHAHPGETIFYLETGKLAFTLLAGEARLVRGIDAFPSGATPSATDTVPIGVEIEMNAGDTLYYDESAVQTERNPGSEDAVAIVINQRGAEEPRIVRVEEASTPAATPVIGGTPVS